MKLKNIKIISILLSLTTSFLSIPADAKDCPAGIIIFQDKTTGKIIDCKTGMQLEALQKANADLRVQISQIIDSTNNIGKKFEKVDKNQLYTQKLIISMQQKLDAALERSKTDKGVQLEQLVIDSLQTSRKLENTLNNKDSKISHELADELSNFNFARANEIMDSLNRIEKGVNRTEGKVDEVLKEQKKTNNPEQFKAMYPFELSKFDSSLNILNSIKGQKDCSVILNQSKQFRISAVDFANSGQYLPAVELLRNKGNDIETVIRQLQSEEKESKKLTNEYEMEVENTKSALLKSEKFIASHNYDDSTYTLNKLNKHKAAIDLLNAGLVEANLLKLKGRLFEAVDLLYVSQQKATVFSYDSERPITHKRKNYNFSYNPTIQCK